MPRTRYVIETGTDATGGWTAGSFHEAFNAADDTAAKGSLRTALTELGYTQGEETHVRLLDPDKLEIARLPLNEAFWTS
ncbi:hypothetical protein [Aureimonas glaciei]|jgi:hypothetical protein|uniref:Uncharacterized protein n=1 Tax=Aureimonas glaciei TaxID=1776957 RepID=A0A916XZ28_9HYPH|nr:hypothetical protein [Aureimonas glaciei]GGD23140.1 hypothetical protein GCM10011335_27550 [Aureimonas glaciei]